MDKVFKSNIFNTIVQNMRLTLKEPKRPVGRWITNNRDWELQAKYANVDSCGSEYCNSVTIKKKLNTIKRH